MEYLDMFIRKRMYNNEDVTNITNFVWILIAIIDNINSLHYDTPIRTYEITILHMTNYDCYQSAHKVFNGMKEYIETYQYIRNIGDVIKDESNEWGIIDTYCNPEKPEDVVLIKEKYESIITEYEEQLTGFNVLVEKDEEDIIY